MIRTLLHRSLGIFASTGSVGLRCCLAAGFLAQCSSSGCGPTHEVMGGAVVVSDRLRAFEGFVHITPDSVARLFSIYDRDTFYEKFNPEILLTIDLLDSLNSLVPPPSSIDTLSIEFDVEQFGVAGRSGKTIYLSSGFFFVYDDIAVIRSILFHEYGHILYDHLTSHQRTRVKEIWGSLQRAALLYVFIDGEYSGNAWFGGHPEEGPGELYASTFNLFHNHPDEVRSTLKYVPEEYYSLIDQLRSELGIADLVLFE